MIRRRSSTTDQPAVIVGERSTPLVARVLSRQAQLSNRLAIGLMLLLGVATLAWYYARQFSRQAHLKESRELAASAAAGTEMALPPLGDIFAAHAGQPSSSMSHVAQRVVGRPSGRPRSVATAEALEPALSAAPLAAGPAQLHGLAAGTPRPAGPLARRLQGAVYASLSAQTLPTETDMDSAGHAAATGPGTPAEATPTSLAAPAPVSAVEPDLLASPDSVPVAARRLRGRSLLLSKGTFIDCTLETAIDSTLPGITSCVTARDTFSADGRVVLLERGTRLFGETQGQVQQGSARVYVLWTEARTPLGVVVPLESPGTDELGRAGLPGAVQRHFWQRFGAAILLSTIDGAVQAAVQASSRNSGTVIYNPGATQDVMTEVLRGTVAIPPTVIKRNGDRIEVLVARDVDFAHVYVLRAAPAGE
ncbi:MAG TPA: type IV secretion system protein VirB10 [Steroidobacteraceae bacterium]|nr:type IV secretion system protein VirB10 [Steroidobacteraceae bacterium]